MTPTGRGHTLSYSLAAGNGAPALNFSTPVENREEWIISRFRMARQWLDRWPTAESDGIGRTDQGRWAGAPLTSRFEGARGSIQTINAALVAVAHWGLETGWGASEYNNNAGGIHCAVNGATCFRDTGHGEDFAAFSSPQAFLQAYFEMIARTPLYQPAWRSFLRGSANGIPEIFAAGWGCTNLTVNEATSLVARVVRTCAEGLPDHTAETFPSESQYAATRGVACASDGENNQVAEGDCNEDGECGLESSGGGLSLGLLGAVAFGVYYLMES